MQLSHDPWKVSAVFDDPNLVSCAGLAPVVALADRVGLRRLVADTVTVSGEGSANAPAKVAALVAGMVAGADSVDDMDLLRHGGVARLFTGVRAPSTLGTFLRTFAFGHVRQLDAVAARVLAGLAQRTPLLPGADTIAYIDVDDTIRATHGYAKQGAGYGYSKVKGLNVLLATISTPLAAPVIAATSAFGGFGPPRHRRHDHHSAADADPERLGHGTSPVGGGREVVQRTEQEDRLRRAVAEREVPGVPDLCVQASCPGLLDVLGDRVDHLYLVIGVL